MQKLIMAILLIGSFHFGVAQQNHFVYIQSDDKLPFTVTLDNKEYTASSIGYVIIPKLQVDKYNFLISFPGQKYPSQEFDITVSKDEGYALKNFGEKGWGLFNLNSLEITMAGDQEEKSVVQKQENNGFGDMLSGAVNDESIKELPAKPIDKAPVVTNPIVQTENVEKEEVKETVSNLNSDPNTENEFSIIELLHKNQSEKGLEMVLVDQASDGIDTVRIYLSAIGSQNEGKKGNQLAAKQKEKVAETEFLDNSGKEEVTENNDKSTLKNPFYRSESNDSSVEGQSIDTKSESDVTTTALNAFREECDNMFTNSELEKLQKKMIGAKSDERMTELAERAIGEKCVISKQVRTLGSLYLSDAARYKFFSAMFPHVYDIGAFANIENQLIDPDYKAKFRQLLK